MQPRDKPVPAEFYDRAYYQDGTKSAYKPYGPGGWARDLASMVWTNLRPDSVLDVGCAHGYLLRELKEAGVRHVCGFDISHYAVDHKVVDNIWQGDAADPLAWRQKVELVVATELPEHLVPVQAKRFLALAATHGSTLLMLGIVGEDDGADQDDHSHINIKPIEWWQEEAAAFNWMPMPADAFNEDPRSIAMGWAGRFMLFGQPD